MVARLRGILGLGVASAALACNLANGFPLRPTQVSSPARLPLYAMAKAEALLRGRLPCLGCHRLGGEGGRIGPDLTGLATRVDAAYVRAVITDPAGTMPGTIMPRVPLPPETVDLIAAYLVQREGRADDLSPVRPAPRAPPPGPRRDRSTLYGAYCAPCHGVSGLGDGYNAPYVPTRPTVHADSAVMSGRPDDTLFDGIHGGGRILGRSQRMPAFAETLTTAEIRGLVSYIRELCGCEGPQWSRDGMRGPS